MASTAQALVICAVAYPSSSFSPVILSYLCPKGLRDASALLSLSPQFIFGALTMFCGGCLRIWCYKTMGQFFTFNITIKEKHRLVIDGPYAFIRHPGYTGNLLITLAAPLIQVGRGTWVTEGNILSTWWILFFVPWLLIATYTVISLHLRIPVEEKYLSQIFKEEWDEYQRRVPYRLIPRLY